ncbi:MAG: hypothetical protein O2963_00160 [Proteobacteria bacterium]|nr:hypothetical protein [Pseudomonadota bacterium]
MKFILKQGAVQTMSHVIKLFSLMQVEINTADTSKIKEIEDSGLFTKAPSSTKKTK